MANASQLGLHRFVCTQTPPSTFTCWYFSQSKRFQVHVSLHVSWLPLSRAHSRRRSHVFNVLLTPGTPDHHAWWKTCIYCLNNGPCIRWLRHQRASRPSPSDRYPPGRRATQKYWFWGMYKVVPSRQDSDPRKKTVRHEKPLSLSLQGRWPDCNVRCLDVHQRQ